MPKVADDVFERQMTETLKVKGVKKMSDLVQHYKSISDALDENVQPLSYTQAKNMTLKFKKRDGDFSELKKMWNQYENQLVDEVVHESLQIHKKNLEAPQQTEVDEIKSDIDLAVVLNAMVQEAFHNPQTGHWIQYDAQFKKSEFTKRGKAGWESNESARDEINRLKNEQVNQIMATDFVKTLIPHVHETLMTRIFGIKKKDVKHAVRNHVRFHLHDLIYSK